jgi:hypothetical protein
VHVQHFLYNQPQKQKKTIKQAASTH